MQMSGVDETGGVAPVLQVALETHQRPHGQLHLLRLTGDLDISTAPDLQAATEVLNHALQLDHSSHQASAGTPLQPVERAVVVDLADLVFLDCAGLTALIALWRTTTRLGASFCLLRPQPQAVRLFALTGADRHVLLCHDLVQALSKHHQPPGPPASSKARWAEHA